MKLFLFIVVGLLMSSCNRLPKTKQQLVAHINAKENGLKQYRESQQGEFTLSYQPNILLPGLSTTSQNYWYFILSLSNEGREYSQNFLASEQEYTKVLEELAFGIDETTYAITNTNDTVYCRASIFARTDGGLNADKILLVFKKENLEQEKTFQMKVDAIGQEFSYKVKDIINIQNIKIKK